MRGFALALAAAGAALTLTGCGTLQGAGQALNDGPREALRSPNLQAAEDIMPEVADMAYALAIMRMPDCTVSGRVAAQPRRRGRSGQDHTAPTVTCSSRQRVNITEAQIEDFLNSSIFVIDAHCSAYLDSLSNLGDTSRWSRSQFNTIANYVGVLMALSGQPTEDLGYLNAATGFFNASADNLETFVLISPSPGSLTPLVQNAQGLKRQELDSVRLESERLRWSSTARWIESYAALCTPRGIRTLLDDAVSNATVGIGNAELSQASSRVAPSVLAVIDSFSTFNGLAVSARNALRSNAALGAFTWRIQAGDALNDDQRDFIRAALGDDLSARLNEAMKDGTQAAMLRQLTYGANAAVFTELRRVQEAAWASQSAEARLRDDVAAARAERDTARRERDEAKEALERARASSSPPPPAPGVPPPG